MTIPTCPHARRDKTRLTAQLQTPPHITANASNPMLGKFIRALLRPISRFALNTGTGAPYCCAIRDAGSGYVLTALRAYAYAIALSRALRSIRARGRPIAAQYGTPAPAMCSLHCAHTPTLSPYLALCAQYALFVALLLRNTGRRLRLCAHCVARIRLRYRPISRFALNTGSLSSRGCAPLTPGCILAPFQGAPFLPRHICHISHRQMSIPLAIFVTSAVGRCPFPLAIYGEGVADRPGVRSDN